MYYLCYDLRGNRLLPLVALGSLNVGNAFRHSYIISLCRSLTFHYNEVLLRVIFQMLCNADFSREALLGRPQVEIVDLVLKLNDRIRNLDEASESSRIRLQSQISAILRSVDDDLKSVLLSNGSLRDCIWNDCDDGQVISCLCCEFFKLLSILENLNSVFQLAVFRKFRFSFEFSLSLNLANVFHIVSWWTCRRFFEQGENSIFE